MITPSPEAPDVFCVERKRAEEINTIFSDPSDNRSRFLRDLKPLLAVPHRFLVIEGAIQYTTGGGRLAQYHKNGMVDFLDALTARYGLHIIHADSREEAEERVANLAALHYAYHLAEQQGLGRCLTENDALDQLAPADHRTPQSAVNGGHVQKSFLPVSASKGARRTSGQTFRMADR